MMRAGFGVKCIYDHNLSWNWPIRDVWWGSWTRRPICAVFEVKSIWSHLAPDWGQLWPIVMCDSRQLPDIRLTSGGGQIHVIASISIRNTIHFSSSFSKSTSKSCNTMFNKLGSQSAAWSIRNKQGYDIQGMYTQEMDAWAYYAFSLCKYWQAIDLSVQVPHLPNQSWWQRAHPKAAQ